MLSQYDLYDISQVFTSLRYAPVNPINPQVVQALYDILYLEETTYEDNRLRQKLREIKGLEREQWEFAFHDNFYVCHRLLKKPFFYNLIREVCRQLQEAYVQKNYEKFSDLADSVHCLPDIMASNDFIIPRDFAKIYIKYYRKKWDRQYLKEFFP